MKISSKRRRLLKSARKDNCLEDIISQLPDEILLEILSLLPTREAASTSILSRRWSYLWQSVKCLNFDVGRNLHETENRKFVRMVNNVLKVHQGNEIDSFRIRCPLDERFSNKVTRWIKFATAKRVKKLELAYTRRHFGHPYRFPTMEELGIAIVGVTRSPDILPFSSLTALRLEFLNVTEEILHYILANCSFLEELSVVGTNSLTNLKVAGPSLKLKKLDLEWCTPLKNLEISAENLVSFTCVEVQERKNVPLKYVPLLSELTIGDGYCASFIFKTRQHSSYLHLLKKLTLYIPSFVVDSLLATFPDSFPTLPNLETLKIHLVLTRGVPPFCLTSLIRASPMLSEFNLHQIIIDYDTNDLASPQDVEILSSAAVMRTCNATPAHKCLKVVELSGFTGHECEYEHALHLIQIAVYLRKIVIDTRRTEPEYVEAAKACARRLETKLRAGQDLIFKQE